MAGRPRDSRGPRVPPPLIRQRLSCGRGATGQPGVTGDGQAVMTPAFRGYGGDGRRGGLSGDLMMLILFSVEHLASGCHAGPFEAGEIV
ncbi:MAG: hypothetical protein M3Z75_32915 [Actinomycetota bacterium]|nr:hypothetical protein [Actinomycetota bacterium]